MIQYIYFVKCPNCEDEHFDFFDEAKEFAMGCLSQKPVITQTEVCRNDFGECTDHSDLGQVWSWEDECRDAEGGYTEAEPTKSIFTKDDLKRMADGEDPEFDNLDNSLDVEEEPVTSEVSTIDEIPDNFRKPIPEGMTIEDLVEEMEENEDTVECTWCNDLFDKSECRKEVDLGWLCSRCEMAIKSRGETLTFKENNYWDFLDEKLDIDIDFSNCVESSDMEIWGIEPISENTYKAVLMKRFENVSFHGYGEIEKVEAEMFDIGGLFVFHFGKDGLPRLGRWDPELLNSLGQCEIIFDDERYDRACEDTLNGHSSKVEELEPEELHDLGNEYDGGYPAEADQQNELEEEVDPKFGYDRKAILKKEVEFYYEDMDYTYVTTMDEVIDALVELVTDEEVAKYSDGRFKTLDEISDYDYEQYLKSKEQKGHWLDHYFSEWTALLEKNCDELLKAHEAEVQEALRDNATEAAIEEGEHTYDDPNEDPDGFYGWSDYYNWKNGPISDFNRR